MTEEQKAEEYKKKNTYYQSIKRADGTYGAEEVLKISISQAFIDGYHECQKEHEGKCKTSYIKGIRTMANALKDYDRTDGAWTDYFEHTVEEVLDRLLKEIE